MGSSQSVQAAKESSNAPADIAGFDEITRVPLGLPDSAA